MQGLGLLLRKESLELVRTRRLPIVLIVFALLGLVSPVVARYIREILEAVGGAEFQGVIPDPVAGDAVAQLTRNLGQFGVLIAILVTMGSVAGEKERGTAAFVLTKPVGRGAFLGAKSAAIGSLMFAAVIVAGILCWIYTALLFEPLPLGGYVAAMALVWLSLAAFASITFAASVIAPSTLVAGGIGLGALMAAGVVSIVPGVSSYLPTGLWGMANQLAVGVVPPDTLGAIVVNVAIVAAALGVAWWRFRAQEL